MPESPALPGLQGTRSPDCAGCLAVPQCGAMRRLPLLYALGCTIWAAHIVQILASFHLSHPEARLGGALLCVLLVVVFPSLLGYVLLFRAFPWVSRLIRR